MVQTQRTKGFRDSSAPVRFSALSAAPPCAAQDADNSGSISKLELVAAMQSGMMSAMTKWSGLVVGFGSFVIEDPFQGIPFLCIGGLSASLVLLIVFLPGQLAPDNPSVDEFLMPGVDSSRVRKELRDAWGGWELGFEVLSKGPR